MHNAKAFVMGRLETGALSSIQQDQSKSYVLRFLSRLVVYDFVAVDTRAFEARALDDLSWLEMVRPTTVPKEIYQSAVTSIDGLWSAFADAPELLGWAWGSSYDLGDKHYFDFLANRFSGLGLASTLADTGLTVPRIFFYLEIAASKQVPLVLHPGKDQLIKRLSQEYRSSVENLLKRQHAELFDRLESEIDEAIMVHPRKVLEQWDIQTQVPSPPLSEYILRVADHERLSPLDAALQIRESREASDFRRWLRQLQIKLTQGGRPGQLAVAQELRELQQLAGQWSEHFDSKYNVTYKPR